MENGVDNLTRKELEFGFGEEDIDGTIIPMATKGQEPTASMGNDRPLITKNSNTLSRLAESLISG